MKVSYHWLQRYVKIDLPPGELCERLTLRGLEVEGFAVAADDFVIEIEVTANRPDLLSHIGVARETAALLSEPLQLPEPDKDQPGPPASTFTSVEIDDPELCPRYIARVIRDVQISPSPPWLQKYLEALGLRPVNNVVDLTNFVLLECGQPLHAFDYDKLMEQRIVVRPAAPGEGMALIDGSEPQLTPHMLVIADAARPVALAGIMGGLDTEVTDATKHILLESASFQPASIRRTARALALQTDASYRFERGVDPEGVDWASRRCAELIAQTCGGTMAAGAVEVNHMPPWKRSVSVRMPRIDRVLGLRVSSSETKRLMTSIGFQTLGESDDVLSFSVPSYRGDVATEIDVIEEVARLHGYEHIPEESTLSIRVAREPHREQVKHLVRTVLAAEGYTEVTCSSLTSVERAQQPSCWAGPGVLALRNPLNPDEAAMRRLLLPSLLDVKRTNQDRGTARTEVFEIAKVYLHPERKPLPDEKTCLTLLEEDTFYDLKGTIEVLADRLGLADKLEMRPEQAPAFDPDLCVKLTIDGRLLGYMGRVAAQEIDARDLRNAPFACELDFDLLVGEAKLERRFNELPKFPAIDRDLAIVVDEAVQWGDVLACARESGGELLESVEFFDLYRGRQIPPGKKSLAFSLHYRSPQRTLRHEEVDSSLERVVAALRERVGATLRA